MINFDKIIQKCTKEKARKKLPSQVQILQNQVFDNIYTFYFYFNLYVIINFYKHEYFASHKKYFIFKWNTILKLDTCNNKTSTNKNNTVEMR